VEGRKDQRHVAQVNLLKGNAFFFTKAIDMWPSIFQRGARPFILPE
jgi:hypothetical protein